MFAVFLHESMNSFHQTATSFPTVIYTVLLIICLLYWIVAVLGIIDIDFIDVDLDGDVDAADSTAAHNALAGLLLKFGLNGVPLTIVLTIIGVIGWTLCYYTSLYATKLLAISGIIKFALDILVFVAATFLTIVISSQVLKPIRKLFLKLNIDETKHILGQTVIVRSGIVNSERGEAFMNDGGAGLLLNIRATGTDEFKKDDEVVVIEQNKAKNTYRVIAKSEFSNDV